MYLGRIVELASSRDLNRTPAPSLHGRAPVGGPDPGPGGRVPTAPDHPEPATCRRRSTRRSGCRFHTRCWLRAKLGNPERMRDRGPGVPRPRAAARGGLPLRRPRRRVARAAAGHGSRAGAPRGCRGGRIGCRRRAAAKPGRGPDPSPGRGRLIAAHPPGAAEPPMAGDGGRRGGRRPPGGQAAASGHGRHLELVGLGILGRHRSRPVAGRGLEPAAGRLGRQRVGGVVLLLRPESISTEAATTSVFQCRLPVSSSHWRVWRRPSTATIAPLPRYCAQMSARRSHAITAWYSAFSRPLPTYSFVATEKVVTCLPEASARISGSRVSRPVKRTLFTVRSLLAGPAAPGRGLSHGRRVEARRWRRAREDDRCGPAGREP